MDTIDSGRYTVPGVASLVRRANKDTDPVYFMAFGKDIETAEGAILIVKGNKQFRILLLLLQSRGFLTIGKPVSNGKSDLTPARDALITWILTEDELPDDSEKVLCWHPHWDGPESGCIADGEWEVPDECYPQTPTHWASWPEGPKGGTQC